MTDMPTSSEPPKSEMDSSDQSHHVSVGFCLNGKNTTVSGPPFRRLLDTLRQDLGLTGTKEGCGEGECGACTVLLDGMPVNSCLIPLIQAQETDIATIEGMAGQNLVNEIQQAFIDHGGAQCGICTPGMVVTASWMVKNGIPASQINQVLAGNICRCTGYGAIVSSIEAAIAKRQSKGNAP